MTAPALRLADVRYRYPGSSRWALDGVSLEIAAGRVLGVVGPNDAGKSTLCLVAAGMAPAVVGGRLEGTVESAGRAGILFADPAAQLTTIAQTVWEEVAFGPRNLGIAVDEIVDRVEAALAALRIEALGPRHPGRLSGGQAQLVALASILALRPSLLVLDEPTSQLDPAGTRLVGDALRRLAADGGTAILVVEHRTSVLAGLADEVAVVDGGRIVLAGDAAAVLADPRLDELGVEPPPPVRLRRAAAARGIALDAALVDAVWSARGAGPADAPDAA